MNPTLRPHVRVVGGALWCGYIFFLFLRNARDHVLPCGHQPCGRSTNVCYLLWHQDILQLVSDLSMWPRSWYWKMVTFFLLLMLLSFRIELHLPHFSSMIQGSWAPFGMKWHSSLTHSSITHSLVYWVACLRPACAIVGRHIGSSSALWLWQKPLNISKKNSRNGNKVKLLFLAALSRVIIIVMYIKHTSHMTTSKYHVCLKI